MEQVSTDYIEEAYSHKYIVIVTEVVSHTLGSKTTGSNDEATELLKDAAVDPSSRADKLFLWKFHLPFLLEFHIAWLFHIQLLMDMTTQKALIREKTCRILC